MVLLKQWYLYSWFKANLSFTFHYGLIKTTIWLFERLIRRYFTFHYGLIKTKTAKVILNTNITSLHSTMVLLKLSFNDFLEEFRNHFTFHYGLIKTKNFSDIVFFSVSLHSTMVLLKRISKRTAKRLYDTLHSTMVLLKP